ncbi:MAG: protocatechuate 3,4-dioxygenase subunit alpha [Devosia sp.]
MLNRLPQLKETPSQTAGPYVHIGLTPNFCDIGGVFAQDPGKTMLAKDTAGQRITITGRIMDGSGAPVSDAVVELWQADADGKHPQASEAPDSAFSGWGRQPTDGNGTFVFETIKPGAVSGPGGAMQAPHVSLWIVARGINTGLATRLYFADEADANASDHVLSKVLDPRRRATLIAARSETQGTPTYTLDIHLQGENETVFFDI